MVSLAKDFLTEVTAVGLLSCVGLAVKVQSTCLAKGFPTEVTSVGLFPSMDPAVSS